MSIFVFLNFCICVDYQPTECVCGLCCHAGGWQGSFSGPQIQREWIIIDDDDDGRDDDDDDGGGGGDDGGLKTELCFLASWL